MRALMTLGLLLVLASPAASATLHADYLAGPAPAFSLEFTDANADGKVQFAEISGFSGFTVSGFVSLTLTRIIALPEITGFADQGALAGTFAPSGFHWGFDALGQENTLIDLAVGASNYSYRISGLTAVPLPGGLALLAAGLGALALLRRKAR